MNLTDTFVDFRNRYSNSLAYDLMLDSFPDREDEIDQIRDQLDGVDNTIRANEGNQTELNLDEIEFTDPVTSAAVFGNLVAAATGESAITVPEDAKPKGKRATKVKAEKAPEAVKAVKADTPKKVSKAELARQMYASADDKSRKVITARFVAELGLTTAGANTYLNNIKKALQGQ